MEMIDIDRLIDELTLEVTKPNSVVSNPSQIGSLKEAETPTLNISELKNGRDTIIRNVSNPNYEFVLESSDDEDSEGALQQIHNTTSSSSSITTSDEPLKDLVSEVQVYLPDISVSSLLNDSLTLSNDIINLDGISSLSSMVEITSNCNKLKSDCMEIDSFKPGNDENEKKVEPLVLDNTKTDERKVVVGFESTMDDVSDTELESYLQDLEEEIQAEETPSNDGDNLSKASTIEFNETKEQEIILEEKLEDPPQSLFHSMELKFADSSTTDPQTHTIENGEEKIEDILQEEKLSETEPQKEQHLVELDINMSSEETAHEEPQVVELMEETETKIARPNSLDFTSPIRNLTSPTDSPGHTPPARVPEDPGHTSSSSEDISVPVSERTATEGASGFDSNSDTLGKIAPFWVPDNASNSCMHCFQKFSLVRRRHHCRGCGQLLCSTCCCLKAKLDYMGDQEARICIQCDNILSKREADMLLEPANRQPNPHNPLEYCSTLPPYQQVSSSNQPISVLVPVGVLKRDNQPRNARKNVIFSDGIRPGTDLTDLDNSWGDSVKPEGITRRNRVQTPPSGNQQRQFKANVKLPQIDEANKSYIPKMANALPPIYTRNTKTDFKFVDVNNDESLTTRLQTETLTFAVQRNFYVLCRIISLTCCVNKTVINFTTNGLNHVGQDELVILLELDDSHIIPKDIFLHLNEIYNQADKGNVITELGFTMPSIPNFLGSKEHGGFLYIRPTFQCLQSIILPDSPYLIGILIHRWEVPWAKIFPLRLMLRLGALYRYYPSPHISVRRRDSVYAEIAQTIINFLADFRTYAYTIPNIRGMLIHMEDRKTSVLIPRNRYDQVMKALNNSSDHILALIGNFSLKAQGHLICIQNTEGPEQLYSYSTQAINIQGQPRKVTGASFIVLNGALKSSSGLSGKCNIVEDGLMVQIMPNKMKAIRDALKNMNDIEIICGPIDAEPALSETVSIIWTENDLNFNIGVISPIDKKVMDGLASIRVHRGLDHGNANHMIRWTEVFMIKIDEESAHGRDPVDISRVSEQIARSTCQALVAFLDLLAAADLIRIGLRVTLDPENVCYEAGSKFAPLAPLYASALDNELIGTLTQQARFIDTPIILELIFHILDK